MPELPWEKWYPTNWASEPGLRLCEPATRGIWFEAINTMMLQQTGQISGSLEQLASLCVCRTSQMSLAIQQLKDFKVADVVEQNGNITLSCRKRVRDCRIKELKRKAGLASATQRQHTLQQSEPTQGATPSASASTYTSASGLEGGVEGTSVQPPRGFPKDENEAVAHSGFVGCPSEFASKTWTKAFSRGGRDSKGVPIHSFRHYLKTEWDYEVDRLSKASGNGGISGADKVILGKEYERVIQEMAQIKRDHDGYPWGDDVKSRFSKLKDRKTELKSILGIKI